MKYDYKIVRSFRETMSISIDSKNCITVRCPWELSRQKVEEFIDSKEEWIERVVTKNAIRLALNDDVLELKKIYVNGKTVPLIIGGKDAFESDAVYISDIDKLCWLYTQKFYDGLVNTARQIAKEARLSPNGIEVRSYKDRWGCCDAANNLIFNYKMFMLPPELQHYIIVHEVCHTVCRNHAPGFWKLVSEYEPDFKQLKARLKEFDFLTALYK